QLKGKTLPCLEEFVVSADKLEEADLTLLKTAFPNLKGLFVEGNPSPELQDKLRLFNCSVHSHPLIQ
ncbi:MAG: hypothetical protein KDK62_03400, partial [Chlamydiia bacterium]|nr:hypothetical protein [Chlamydiia bacterium]